MQSVKPLRLKREVYRASAKSDSRHIAQVWVDSGLTHLDGLYSYLIPDEMLEFLAVGSRVKVPFNSRSCEALVVDVEVKQETQSNLKTIESLLGDIPVANEALIHFYSKMAEYWVSDPYSIIKLAIPARVAAMEKNVSVQSISSTKGGILNRKKIEKSFLMHSPHMSAYSELVELVKSRLKKGSVLLLVPDLKDVERMCLATDNLLSGVPVMRLDSSLSRGQRYENYLRIITSDRVLVIGTRSALFAPVNNLESIIVAFEKSEQYYEQKHPYWNVRDSVFLRAKIEECSVFFTGYIPSAEIARQIEERKIAFIGEKRSINTVAFTQDKGELLPDRLISQIRKNLPKGRILFLGPRKGYANALLCAKCKNISLCECGGRHFLSSLESDPICSFCAKSDKNWSCKWCASTRKYAASRGIERFYEEIGRAFPNTPIQLSAAPNILEDIAIQTKIVIATTGSIPGKIDDYAAVVILEGQRFLASASTAYEEMVYESFFEAASRVKKDGSVFVVLDSFHPVVAALSRWNPASLIKKILRESLDAGLPPYSNIAIVRLEESDGVLLKNGLLKSIKDGRLPSTTKVYLSKSDGKDQARLIISVAKENRNILVLFLRELVRKRAISRKSAISISLDPYTLLT